MPPTAGPNHLGSAASIAACSPGQACSRAVYGFAAGLGYWGFWGLFYVWLVVLCLLLCQVTVSTVGLVDKLEVFAANPNAPHLALSLHATTDEVRHAALSMSPPITS
jgi:hypothetical protein